jgi:hypothetical protein
MPMLNGVLRLYDVRDVEKLCRKVLIDDGRVLQHEFDDRLADLIDICWELSLRYDTDKQGASGWRFEEWAYCTLRNRLIDIHRKRWGNESWRAGQPNREYSLDTADSDSRPRDLPTSDSGSETDPGADALLRLLGERSSERARDKRVIRAAITRRRAA